MSGVPDALGAPTAAQRWRGVLHPWADPPDGELLTLAPASWWQEHQALPVMLDQYGLLVATAAPPGDSVVAELQRYTHHPVETVSAAPDEVAFWLDVLQARLTWAEAVARGLAALFNEMGLHVIQERPLRGASGQSLSVEQVMDAFGLTEDVAMDGLALQARLPQLRPEKYAISEVNAALLPREIAASLRVVPLVVRPGMAIVAGPQVLSRPFAARLANLAGLEVRYAVCSPVAFQETFATLYGSTGSATGGAAAPAPPGRVRGRAAPQARAQAPAGGAVSARGGWQRGDGDAILAEMERLGVLDARRLDAVRHVARAFREEPLATALRLQYVTAQEVQHARAAALGMAVLEDARARVDRQLAARAAPALWRRWKCFPAGHDGGAVVLGCSAPLDDAQAPLIQHLLGASAIEPRFVEPDQLACALEDLPDPLAPPYTVEDHFEESGVLRPGQVSAARRASQRNETSLVQTLRSTGVVGDTDVVEALALATHQPWIRLDRYSPPEEVRTLLPEALARSERLVAIARRGMDLLVAPLEPRLAPRELLVDLGRATDLDVRAVLAVTEDPDALLARWYAGASAGVPGAYEELGRFLVRRGLLSPGQVQAAWRRLERGAGTLDQALAERDLLSPEAAASAIATFLSLPMAHLEASLEESEVVDPLGQLRREMVWRDPVDHAIARLAPGQVAQRCGAIPFAEDADTVQVAFANPLDEAAVADMEVALGRPVRPFVATRRAVELAQRRVYATKSIGEFLAQRGTITQAQLRRALDVHDMAGVRLGQALVNLGFVAEEELCAALAEQAGLPFFDLHAVAPDPDLAALLPMELQRTRGVIPLYDDGEAIVVACDDLPEACGLDEIEPLLGRPLRPVIVTESALDEALNALHGEAYLDHAASHLLTRSPDDSARWVLSQAQKRFFIGLLVTLTAAFVASPRITSTVLVSLSTLFYVSFAVYKFYLAYRAVQHTLEVETTAEELAAMDDRHPPVYTILVPVYREAEVFPILAKAIERLDYPKAKLDVKILLEEDDGQTIGVARSSRLPSHFKLVVVPQGHPKGKPKACNYGLIHAKGKYVVIYDAEDIPEPDQLKKAIVAFQKGSANLMCVQAKLNYFNRDQNMLTRWFTTEYSMWFDLFLPGLDASGAPIPLGGTSNHFKTERLRELGAWDPYNVTEDADLGIRRFKAGGTTAVIDSTTYEEANSDVYNWIRQRSRWVKGYIQTYLVHMRHPVRLWRAVGPHAFISFQLVVGGTFFGFLVNPIFWVLTALWFTVKWAFIEQIFPGAIYYIGCFGLYFGNFAFTYLNVAGCLRRGYDDMVKYALLSPLYWALMSVAAWKGFLQLFYAPSYWEKTNHGLYKGPVPSSGLPAGATGAPQSPRAVPAT